MAPSLISTILELPELQKRSLQSDFTPKDCDLIKKAASAADRTCCPAVATCVPNTDLCALPFIPAPGSPNEKLYVKQSPCLEQERIFNQTLINGTTATGALLTAVLSNPTIIPTPTPIPTGPPQSWDSSSDSDDDNPAAPLIFAYPLIILAALIIVLVCVYVFYWRSRGGRRESEEGAEGNAPERTGRRRIMGMLRGGGGSGGEGEEECHNDSTVDLELPCYEEHSWTSRWAAHGRNRQSGGAGEIVEVVNLRGQRGDVVPVAMVRMSTILAESPAVSGADGKGQGWMGKIRGLPRLARAKRSSGRAATELSENSEWGVDPPAYTEEAAPNGIKPPEPVVVAR